MCCVEQVGTELVWHDEKLPVFLQVCSDGFHQQAIILVKLIQRLIRFGSPCLMGFILPRSSLELCAGDAACVYLWTIQGLCSVDKGGGEGQSLLHLHIVRNDCTFHTLRPLLCLVSPSRIIYDNWVDII